ncbi:MAG: TIGR02710 family CRISPR-associated protein, partial [Microbacteriaceae bacterium]|nr:TIGR02710 family CRISPR-associated protein [Microbacteriaceae bacterium]
DRFEHREALRLIEPYAPRLGDAAGPYLQVLRFVTNAGGDSDVSNGPRREGLLIWDLWLNAGRRAAAGRYDDAVARIYRVIEWTAQWILRRQSGIDTADIAVERIPAGVYLAPGRNGKYQAGLFAAWCLVEAHTTGAAALFFRSRRDVLLAHLDRRNTSILAHGFAAIDRAGWEETESSFVADFVPMLRDEMRAAGVRHLHDQLPRYYAWDGP